jgi:hypothetical protein
MPQHHLHGGWQRMHVRIEYADFVVKPSGSHAIACNCKQCPGASEAVHLLIFVKPTMGNEPSRSAGKPVLMARATMLKVIHNTIGYPTYPAYSSSCRVGTE